jgi:argininosuccinate lyase
LTALLVVLKGLPLAYAKDMQEDKEPAFDAFDSLALSIAAVTGIVADMTPDRKTMRKAAGVAYATATDLADWLVRVRGLPFRQAHEVTGRIVAAAEAKGVALEKLPLAEMQAVEPGITTEVYAVLGPQQSVKSRTSYGGTAPENVRREARRWLKRLGRPPKTEKPA